MPPSPRAGEPADGEAVTAGREGRLGSAEGLCQHRLSPYETRRWAMAERGRFAMKAGVGGCRAAGVRVRLCAGRRLRVIGTLGPCSPGLGDSDTREDLGGTSEIMWFAPSLPLPPQPHPTDLETQAQREAGSCPGSHRGSEPSPVTAMPRGSAQRGQYRRRARCSGWGSRGR